MTPDEMDDRTWEADKREFVADRRDDIAAERDTTADDRDEAAEERERLADEREAELDEREMRLDARAVDLALPLQRSQQESNEAATERRAAKARREVARMERDLRRDERNLAETAREEASKRRQVYASKRGLAMAFAEIARYLYESENFEDVLDRIVETTVSTLSGCDMASITVREGDKKFVTRASTQSSAIEVDTAQYQANEGPCLDAIEHPVVYAAFFPDPRWPALDSRPLESGVQAVVSFRLTATGPTNEDALEGSLNAYATQPNAFDDEAQEIGLILAAHATVAGQAVGEREALEQLGRHLHAALGSRDVIGQAKGILMERLRITPEDAFDVLRRSSQQLNVKLRDIAQRLTETGEIANDDRG